MALSATTRRLLKETKELSSSSPNPNPAFHASPVSDTDLFEWHFTLLGPPSPSPYANGLYHGRISLPPQYPYKPPNFRFLTPSGRFEVNREICLSISGFHEETWQPAWGIRTALTALRSFMAEKGTAGQVGGLESSEEVRRRLAKESRAWRCGGCEEGGRRSNEERMREWWEICEEKGVKVDESGEVRLEALPGGLEVVAIEKGRATEGQNEQKQQLQEESQIASSAASPQPQSISHQPSSPPRPSQTQPAPSSPASTPARTTASPNPNNLPLPPQFTHPYYPARQQQAPENIVTIDRAIGAIFLALCVMILKKVFYPSSSSGMGFGLGGGDDLRMIRE